MLFVYEFNLPCGHLVRVSCAVCFQFHLACGTILPSDINTKYIVIFFVLLYVHKSEMVINSQQIAGEM